MDNILVAYSANKKIEDELRQQERLLERQQVKMLSRIGREKSELFDTLIQLNVRTPHPQTKSTDSERIRLKRVELDAKELPPKSLSLMSGKKRQRRPKYVTPVIDQTGGDVYCQIQEDTDSRRKLETDSRTSNLLYKSVNIARCLEALGGRQDKMAGGSEFRKDETEKKLGLIRSRTFTERIAERNKNLPMTRAKTVTGTKPRNGDTVDTSNVGQLSVPDDTVSVERDSSSRLAGEKMETPYLISFQHLVYFNIRRSKQTRRGETMPQRRIVRSRQSLLRGYVPFRGVPGMDRGWVKGSRVTFH